MHHSSGDYDPTTFIVSRHGKFKLVRKIFLPDIIKEYQIPFMLQLAGIAALL
jgi:hypothetical protein